MSPQVAAAKMSGTAGERTETNLHGYRAFQLGSFNFRRDEYFAHIAASVEAAGATGVQVAFLRAR